MSLLVYIDDETVLAEDDATWTEAKHPRDADGKFTTAPAGSGATNIKQSKVIVDALKGNGFQKVKSGKLLTYLHPNGIRVVIHPPKEGQKFSSMFSIKGFGKELAGKGGPDLHNYFGNLVKYAGTLGQQPAPVAKPAEPTPAHHEPSSPQEITMALEGFGLKPTWEAANGTVIKFYSGEHGVHYDFGTNEWSVDGGMVEGKGWTHLENALTDVIEPEDFEPEPEPEPAKPEAPEAAAHKLLTNHNFQVKGPGENFGAGKSIVYSNIDGKGSMVEWAPSATGTGTWILATPGYPTKTGSGLDNLEALLNGEKHGGKNTWQNTNLVPGYKVGSATAVAQPKAPSQPEGWNIDHKAAAAKFVDLGNKAPQTTPEQGHAIATYCGSGYASINAFLRSHPSSISTNKTVKAIDDYMQTAELPEEVTVFRKVGGEFANMLKSVLDVGSVFVEKGFCSSSLDPESWHGNLKAKITVPKGAKGACVKNWTAHQSEREVLLQRHTFFRVDKIDIPNGRVELTAIAQGMIDNKLGEVKP